MITLTLKAKRGNWYATLFAVFIKKLHVKRLFTRFFFSTFDVNKFGKTRRHHSKERLKISKMAKFESDLLKAYKDIAPPSREILQTFAIYRLCQLPF